ncbi:MAG: response regulator, partial [Ideonella sp.]|nr:response regulator [Ideonella sp.]
ERARRTGELSADAKPTEAELAGMIFRSGFTTSEEVTELAGRGVGMDVVRAEVTSLGGRIDTASATGRGTAFQLVLPLTTAVTQVVVLNCDDLIVAVPSNLVERVMRTPVQDVEAAYRDGVIRVGEDTLPFFWMGGLLEHGGRGALEGKTASIVVARSASQRVALHVSQVLGNQEVVVKNLGLQLARLPALSGLSMLPDGQTVLIYNPVALAAIYGAQARDRTRQADTLTQEAVAGREMVLPLATLVMVVDDSLTVRRVTQRLLQREGYRVQLAKDGLEALELLGSEKPAVVLSDIEMPRMDGFDLLRNLRADARLRDLPVVMITSRIAQRHHDLAMTLGANEYLGKPYDEQALLNLVRGFVDAAHGVGGKGLTESG